MFTARGAPSIETFPAVTILVSAVICPPLCSPQLLLTCTPARCGSKLKMDLKRGGNLLVLRGSHPLGSVHCKEHLQLLLCSVSFPQIPWPAPSMLAPLSHALWECSAQLNISPGATQIKSSVDPSAFNSGNFPLPAACLD